MQMMSKNNRQPLLMTSDRTSHFLSKSVLCLALLLLSVAYSKAQTYLIEAEKFQYQGGWRVERDEQASGKALLMVTGGGSSAADAITVFALKQAADYTVWTRTKDFKQQAPRTRISRMLINNTEMEKQGMHGQDGFYWEKVGKLFLDKGNHVLIARDVNANYARLDAVLLTTDAALDPNKLSMRRLKDYEIQPVATSIKDNKNVSVSQPQPLLPVDAASVCHITNGLLSVDLYKSGEEILHKTRVRVGNEWRSVVSNQADHRFYLLKSANPGLNFSAFFPAWTGVRAKKLLVNNAEYPVYDPKDMMNPFLSGDIQTIQTYRYERLNDKSFKLYHRTVDGEELISQWTLPSEGFYIDVTFELLVKRTMYYSFVVAALNEQDENTVSNVLLSPMHSFRRFPDSPQMLPMALTPQPVCMVESEKMTSFVTGNPQTFSRSWGVYDMGFSLKNINNKIQPVAFAPILGRSDSYLQAGTTLRKSFKIGLVPAPWNSTLQYVSDSIFQVRDYRRQTSSLTGAVFRIINLLKQDEACGWEKDMRGYLDIESNPKVRTEVVQQSPVGLLSAAVITRDEDLYLRRALPGIEYMLSRKGYRWGYPNERDPQTPTMVNTFTPFASEYNTGHYEALHRLLGDKNPWLKDVAMPNGKPRYSKGYAVDVTWSDDLAAYRLTGDEQWLVKAGIGADYMIQNELYKNPSKPMKDWMFYNVSGYPQWFDLLDMYEATRNPEYFNAAAYGAYFTIAGQRSYPLVKGGDITIHKDGKYTGNANIFFKKDKRFKLGYPRQMGDVQEKTVSEDLLSPVGLGFEQPMTFFTKQDNLNHVFMSTWAPSLLRLNQNGRYPFFETYARNSVIGRFASYPGYYAAGYTDLPLDSIYPYKGPDVTSLYYHHIPSHLTFTLDYLITEAVQRSKNAVSFPYGKQQGFVWFNNRVYGGRKGSILHDGDVQLYLNEQAVHLSAADVNHITALSDNYFWLILLNENAAGQKVDVKLNTPFVAADTECTMFHFAQSNSMVSEDLAMSGNTLQAPIQGKGITLLAFPLAHKMKTADLPPVADGMKAIDIGKNNKLYVFRIRSPFGWDSVYAYIDSDLSAGCTVSLSCEEATSDGDEIRTAFPYEWSFVKLKAQQPLHISVTLKQGTKILDKKQVQL